LQDAAGFVFGPDGNLYVASSLASAVLRFEAGTGAFVDTFVAPGSGGLSGARCLAFGPDGALYASSAGRDQVLRYDGRSGAFLGAFASDANFRSPTWLAFTPAVAPGLRMSKGGVGEMPFSRSGL